MIGVAPFSLVSGSDQVDEGLIQIMAALVVVSQQLTLFFQRILELLLVKVADSQVQVSLLSK